MGNVSSRGGAAFFFAALCALSLLLPGTAIAAPLLVWPDSPARSQLDAAPTPWAEIEPGPLTVVPNLAPQRGASPQSSTSSRGLGKRRSASASHTRLPNRPSVTPFSAHGKLLVRFAGSATATCSGTVINTPNKSVVATAAHCIREGFGRSGAWARHVAFIPAYERGRRPFGTFRARKLWVPRQYWQFENPNFDVGFVRLRPNQRGRVARVAGARGWATGVSRNRRYRIFGYPAASLRGEVPRICDGRVHGIREVARFLPGPAPSRIFCDMARGSSGGGWIYGGRYLNSVIGYAQFGRPGVLYGPYFGEDVRGLIERVGA